MSSSLPQARARRINVFAILLWVVAAILLIGGIILRQAGIAGYASTYANSATATDELAFYTAIISGQYTAELGNNLIAAGGIATGIAVLFHALAVVIRRTGESIAAAAQGENEITTASPIVFIDDDHADDEIETDDSDLDALDADELDADEPEVEVDEVVVVVDEGSEEVATDADGEPTK